MPCNCIVQKKACQEIVVYVCKPNVDSDQLEFPR